MGAIELAPGHKSGLVLANPVMIAAGCFGFGTEYAKLLQMETLGAVVVGPVTAGPRRGADPPRVLSSTSLDRGMLLHTGLANPGIAAITRRYARAWARWPVPVIVHVAGTSPGAVSSCCARLSRVEAVAGIELGLPDTDDVGYLTALVGKARTSADQPLLVRLPLASAVALCETVVESGADALTVAAPPRGALWEGTAGRFITGRLYGPFVLPLALHILRKVSALVSVPLVGCGGIYSTDDAQAFLRAGAAAVQLDSAIWHDPSCATSIADLLASASEQRL